MIKLDLSGTTTDVEAHAGLTTFATMACIVAVTRLILAAAGVNVYAVLRLTDCTVRVDSGAR